MTLIVSLIIAAIAALIIWRWALSGVRASTEIALVGTVSGLAIAGRVLVTGVPGLEPVTVIVVCVTAALGIRRGAAVGLLSIAVSNLVAGEGPWTVWQMCGFGLVAAIVQLAIWLRMVRPRPGTAVRERVSLGALTMICALSYDLLLTASQQLLFVNQPLTLSAYGHLLAVGAPFTIIHVTASAVFGAAVGPALLTVLLRARTRLDAPRISVASA